MTQALSYLSARERACVVLSQRDHLNYEQIADLLAIGVQEVRDAFKSGIIKMVEENHKAALPARSGSTHEVLSTDVWACPHPTLYARDMLNQPQPWGACLLCERDRMRKALGALALQILQQEMEAALDWARSVRVTFPNGEPEVSL